MKKQYSLTRRTLVKGSLFGLFAASIPNLSHGSTFLSNDKQKEVNEGRPYGYPSIDDEIISEVVGKSHFDLDRVKELVDKRPELSRATWDWGFGDFESAIGAASHVGRRDIVEYLLSKGARPNIFTYAMLGAYDTVKSMITFTPGIQRTLGPHGISLLAHAQAGLRMKSEMSESAIASANELINYLQSLGDADAEQYEDLPDDEKPKYLGDYKYGEKAEEGFSVKLNMRKLLSLGKIGAFGGALYKIGPNKFFYNGAPSTEISFQFDGKAVKSLTVTEPGSVLVAKKVS